MGFGLAFYNGCVFETRRTVSLPSVPRIVGVALLLGLLAGTANAQDSHYWTTQYGTRGQLLGGAVVGSIGDLSSTFYNPGALALSKDPKLVLSTDAFEVQRIQFRGGVGEG